VNENKYIGEVLNAVGSYCALMLCPDSTMGLTAACYDSVPQDPSKTAPKKFQGMSQELPYSYKPPYSRTQGYLILYNAFIFAQDWNSVPVISIESPEKPATPANPGGSHTNLLQDLF
jgi:hypothetical protein